MGAYSDGGRDAGVNQQEQVEIKAQTGAVIRTYPPVRRISYIAIDGLVITGDMFLAPKFGDFDIEHGKITITLTPKDTCNIHYMEGFTKP